MSIDRSRFRIINELKHLWPAEGQELQPGDSVEGTLKEKRPGVGSNKSNVYFLVQDGGEEIGVWGSTVIDSAMRDVEIGTYVGIEFAGMKSPRGGGAAYKDFIIGVRETAKAAKK